jgi:hypothetical protein
MANRPANAGSDRANPNSAGPGSHRATGPRPVRTRDGDRDEPAVTGVLAWLPYLILLAGTAAGMFVAWRGSAYAIRGISILGASLLAAALTRLLLPNRFAGMLASRRKASDVLAFAVFGAALLAVALSLP